MAAPSQHCMAGVAVGATVAVGVGVLVAVGEFIVGVDVGVDVVGT